MVKESAAQKLVFCDTGGGLLYWQEARTWQSCAATITMTA